MEAYVQITGYVGTDVELRPTSGVASFRVASTPRYRKNGDWVDGNPTWLTVTCWRSLAEHAAESIRKGDPVIVIGKLRTNVWKGEDGVVERLILEATSIGHDLSRGTAVFSRVERVVVPEDQESDVQAAIAAVEAQARDPDEEVDEETGAGERLVGEAPAELRQAR
jgi:single-strand DNA-binding protein